MRGGSKSFIDSLRSSFDAMRSSKIASNARRRGRDMKQFANEIRANRAADMAEEAAAASDIEQGINNVDQRAENRTTMEAFRNASTPSGGGWMPNDGQIASAVQRLTAARQREEVDDEQMNNLLRMEQRNSRLESEAEAREANAISRVRGLLSGKRRRRRRRR
jgi:hypothetical protein